MAQAGQTIRNPVTGETTTFLATAADTGGRVMRLDMTADPSAAGATEHVHPRLTERYDLQEGRLIVRMRGRDHVVSAGERLEIPRGTPHSFRNPDARSARVVVEYEPAGRYEEFIETFYALARDGKTNAEGRPNLLQTAVILHAHLDDVALPRPPLLVQRLMFALLAPIGRLAGYRSRYPGA
jgi:mannose-6-phosphate isomerase-like protein (cupin superfamily)